MGLSSILNKKAAFFSGLFFANILFGTSVVFAESTLKSVEIKISNYSSEPNENLLIRLKVHCLVGSLTNIIPFPSSTRSYYDCGTKSHTLKIGSDGKIIVPDTIFSNGSFDTFYDVKAYLVLKDYQSDSSTITIPADTISLREEDNNKPRTFAIYGLKSFKVPNDENNERVRKDDQYIRKLKWNLYSENPQEPTYKTSLEAMSEQKVHFDLESNLAHFTKTLVLMDKDLGPNPLVSISIFKNLFGEDEYYQTIFEKDEVRYQDLNEIIGNIKYEIRSKKK